MSWIHVYETLVTVTVSGGIGTATFSVTGQITDVYISAPNGATYDWNITGPTGTPRIGEMGVSGSRSVDCNNRPCQGTSTITMANATNGTYTFSINTVLAVSYVL